MVTSARQLYFSGESLRNTQKFLALQNVKVSHQTIYNWIGRYVGLMEKYLHVKGDNKWSTLIQNAASSGVESATVS